IPKHHSRHNHQRNEFIRKLRLVFGDQIRGSEVSDLSLGSEVYNICPPDQDDSQLCKRVRCEGSARSLQHNYGVICEDEAKRRNYGTKTKTFEENAYLLPYAVSSKEDTAYHHKKTHTFNSLYGVSLFTYTQYIELVVSQRFAVNVIDGN
ncbi:hypothetical protein Tco_0456319, partial [Tanacetum coccineum]